ncbi:hypothetical protein [Undibacterium terreum]|uniref:Uncharacterized protein n=1 Tax=Undibacterium terreum TaxID=1224302 RepID=A0A916U2W1_9BURK|nr:hypothetical protein [Undibacterium terreum]GGC58261.1 hypothetical protein GCM10011396_01390 [Undibacterium terreum]
MPHATTFEDEYTRKVSGEKFQYKAEFSSGENAVWKAFVYQEGDFKGEIGGRLVDNAAVGNDLRMYVISYIETMIEKGLGIEE